jgi:protein gp37
MDPAWAIDVRDQCCKANVLCFFKQWGGKNKKRAVRVLDGQIRDRTPADPSCRPNDGDAHAL